jgi:FKBP-type peptidyl-prolyl cis-trans isomerase
MFNNIKIGLALAVIMASCGPKDGFETSDSGLQYKFINQNASGQQPEEGQVVTLNLSLRAGDSVLLEASEMAVQKIQQTWNVKGGIEEAFAMLSKGDSIVAKVKAGDLYQRTWQMSVPPTMNPEDIITCTIGLDDIYTEQEYQQKQALARVEEVDAYRTQALYDKKEQMETDIALIDAYLAKNNIEAQTTESGMRYAILEEGTGPKPEIGDMVRVNYTGNVLDGDYFDTSVEENAKKFGLYNEARTYEPFEFMLGTGGVIHGWDEGIALLNQGTRARLYIPSPMAYGENQRSAVIVANAILEFEVELVGVNSN